MSFNISCSASQLVMNSFSFCIFLFWETFLVGIEFSVDFFFCPYFKNIASLFSLSFFSVKKSVIHIFVPLYVTCLFCLHLEFSFYHWFWKIWSLSLRDHCPSLSDVSALQAIVSCMIWKYLEIWFCFESMLSTLVFENNISFFVLFPLHIFQKGNGFIFQYVEL